MGRAGARGWGLCFRARLCFLAAIGGRLFVGSLLQPAEPGPSAKPVRRAGDNRGIPLTTSTRAEPAWHRRARRDRQHARALLALDRARRVLQSHHGGGMGAGRDDGKGKGKGKGPLFTDWVCECGYRNHGHRAECRVCGGAPTPGTRRPKGAGKGGGGGGKGAGANAWGIGGIAQRQLRQQAEAEKISQSKIDKLRAEHKKEMDKIQRQLGAARKGDSAPEELDVDDNEDGDDEGDDDKEQKLTAELRQVENLVKGLEDGTPFKDIAKKRAEDARKELESLRERRGGPEAKILGMAGRHEKALRSARNKLLRKTKAQSRMEEELDALEKQHEEIQERINQKRKSLGEVKEGVQQAQAELERLSKAGGPQGGAGGGGGGDDEAAGSDDLPRGPRERAQLLANQLSSFLPPAFKEQLDTLLSAASRQREEQDWNGGNVGGVGSGGKPPMVAEKGEEKDEEDSEEMLDLEACTIEMLDGLLEASEGAHGEGGKADDYKPTAIPKRLKDTSPAKLRKVIKGLKDKKHEKDKAKGAVAATAGKPKSGESEDQL